MATWWPFRGKGHPFAMITARGDGARAGGGGTEPLGQGLWRRAFLDCEAAQRDAPQVAALLPAVHALAQDAHQRWPSSSLDVPADPDGRAAYARLQAVRRALREAAYRSRLAEAGLDSLQQQQRRDAALRAAAELLTRPQA